MRSGCRSAAELLDAEKELTRRGDELARQRQELPWVPVEKEYRFETDDGTAVPRRPLRGPLAAARLPLHVRAGLHGGVPVLLGDRGRLSGSVVHLRPTTTSLLASRAPLAKLQDYKQRMGWSFPLGLVRRQRLQPRLRLPDTRGRNGSGPSSTTFARDIPAPSSRTRACVGTVQAGTSGEGPGLSVFALVDGVVYRTYVTSARGLEPAMAYYAWLDRAPLGRNEKARSRCGSAATTNTKEAEPWPCHRAQRRSATPPAQAKPSAQPAGWPTPGCAGSRSRRSRRCARSSGWSRRCSPRRGWRGGPRRTGWRGWTRGPGPRLGSVGWFTGVWATMMAAMMLPSLAPTRSRLSRRWSRRELSRVAPVRLRLSARLECRGHRRLRPVRAREDPVRRLAGLAQRRPLACGGSAGPRRALPADAAQARVPLEVPQPPAIPGRLLQNTRPGALVMGLRNGGWCLGCSWALMAALFALGVMSLMWMGLIAVLVALEKIGTLGPRRKVARPPASWSCSRPRFSRCRTMSRGSSFRARRARCTS